MIHIYMTCPNCEKEMQDKSHSYWSIGDWDSDYPSGWHEEFYCKNCKIRFINGEWEIPKKFAKPTDKQIRTVLFINSKLGTNCIPLLKTQCWKFISENFEEAKKQAEYDREEYGEWYREEYGEFEYY